MGFNAARAAYRAAASPAGPDPRIMTFVLTGAPDSVEAVFERFDNLKFIHFLQSQFFCYYYDEKKAEWLHFYGLIGDFQRLVE